MSSEGEKTAPPAEEAEVDADADALHWGLPLNRLYRLSLSFYRDKEGKAIHLGYEDRLKLMAFAQQAARGPFDEKTAPPLGVLDVIGRDRRAAWLELGDLSQRRAMIAFVNTLDRLCPSFGPYVEANRKEAEERNRTELERDGRKGRSEVQKRAEREQLGIQRQKSAEEERTRRIKDALNEQTYEQFVQYARQQFPGNPDQQAVLVRQLQDQHYHQYVRQLALDGTGRDLAKDRLETVDDAENASGRVSENSQKTESENNDDSSPERPDDGQSDEDGLPAIASASMWTRGGVAQFKQTVRSAAGGGGVLQVGHGETVTVRVPTHARGRCLFWEFATDNFDIGFGVYFEWSKSPTTRVTVHVAESDDEADPDGENFDDDDDDDDDDEEEIVERRDDDLESGADAGNVSSTSKPPMSIIIPIYRRDSHSEVYAGSHAYPGEGVYLLKFDNTYSLWRSKTLYYRVYYTR